MSCILVHDAMRLLSIELNRKGADLGEHTHKVALVNDRFGFLSRMSESFAS